jgi:hypothetical protein
MRKTSSKAPQTKRNIPLRTSKHKQSRNLLDTVFLPPSEHLHSQHTFEMRQRCQVNEKKV